MKTADSFAKHEKLLHPLDIDAHWLQEPTNFYSNSNNTKDYKTTLLRDCLCSKLGVSRYCLLINDLEVEFKRSKAIEPSSTFSYWKIW